jgi:hypothetical protein
MTGSKQLTQIQPEKKNGRKLEPAILPEQANEVARGKEKRNG